MTVGSGGENAMSEVPMRTLFDTSLVRSVGKY
jgi:hypothetical protein